MKTLNQFTFEKGSHRHAEGHYCALEACNYLRRNKKTDSPIPGIPASAILPQINDWPGWMSDAERTEFLRPYVQKFLDMPSPDPATERKVYALVDYACRVISVEAINAVADAHPDPTHRDALRDHAKALAALNPVTDAATAIAAMLFAQNTERYAATASPYAAANAALLFAQNTERYAVGYAATAAEYAAPNAALSAWSAADAARNTANAARSTADFKRHAKALLDIATN